MACADGARGGMAIGVRVRTCADGARGGMAITARADGARAPKQDLRRVERIAPVVHMPFLKTSNPQSKLTGILHTCTL